MIGVDTNILVRFFAQDSVEQAQAARDFLAQRTADDPAYVSTLVIAELAWSLKSIYGYAEDRVGEVIQILLQSFNVMVERADLVAASVELAHSKNAGIADCLIAAIAISDGCDEVVTFDKLAAKRIPGMDLLT